MNILITGAGGYVGSELVDYLLKKTDHNITAYDLFIFDPLIFDTQNKNKIKIIKGDIRDGELLNDSLNGIDLVIHLACISNDPSFDLNPSLGKSINFDCFPNIVKLCKKNGVKRFIYASSSSVYGISDEKNVHENSSKNPLTDYSKYKLLCEEILLNEINDHFEGIIIRPATVCGYSRRLRLDLVVNIFTSHAYFNRKINVFGGSQLRPNINIKDMVRAYCKLIDLEKANLVLSSMESDVEINTTFSNDNRSYHISSELIKKEINFEPKYNIKDAIDDLLNNFKNLKNPFNMDKFFNIKLMQKINLK